MSFVRRKTIKGHDYYYLVRSQREGDTVRQIHIKYIGKNPTEGGRTYPHDPQHPEAQYLYKYKSFAQREVMMSPDEFLGYTNTLGDFTKSQHYSEKNYQEILKKMKEGKFLDPPYLDVRELMKDEVGYESKEGGIKWRVSGHEGRHRVWAAKELGIEAVPVIIFYKDPEMHHMMAPEKVVMKEIERQNPFSFVES